MSGHSKWHNIAAKKGKADAARGKIFTKLGRELKVAVNQGGPDPASNSKLKDVIFYNYVESISSADYMFNGCSSLTELSIPGFKIGYGAKYAFAGCSSLRFLDISLSSCFVYSLWAS